MIAFIELPEGSYAEVSSIVGFAPRPATSEFDTDPAPGCCILLASGHTLETEETVERVLHQLAEVIARANEEEE